jgi:hypothetical protein
MPLPAFERGLEPKAARESAPRQPLAIRAGALEPLDPLWQRLQSNGGIDVRDRVWRLRNYPQCFVGHELVDWLVRHEQQDRESAVRVGRRLLALGRIHHVSHEHDFEDGFLFYRITADLPTQRSEPLAADLAEAMRDAGRGLSLADHKRGLVRHARCCTGRAVIDWIVAAHGVPRATALQWARDLMRRGRLRHVYDDRPFTDSRGLFRLG